MKFMLKGLDEFKGNVPRLRKNYICGVDICIYFDLNNGNILCSAINVDDIPVCTNNQKNSRNSLPRGIQETRYKLSCELRLSKI